MENDDLIEKLRPLVPQLAAIRRTDAALAVKEAIRRLASPNHPIGDDVEVFPHADKQTWFVASKDREWWLTEKGWRRLGPTDPCNAKQWPTREEAVAALSPASPVSATADQVRHLFRTRGESLAKLADHRSGIEAAAEGRGHLPDPEVLRAMCSYLSGDFVIFLDGKLRS